MCKSNYPSLTEIKNRAEVLSVNKNIDVIVYRVIIKGSVRYKYSPASLLNDVSEDDIICKYLVDD